MSGDPHYNYTSLLLPFTGANNSTTFADASPTPKAITRFGDTKISTTQSKWGGGSGYFDGSGDYLLLADSAAWFFAGDFTIEFYAFCTANVEFEFIAQRAYVAYPFWGFRRNVGGALRFFYIHSATGIITDITSTAIVALNQWRHIALTRKSGTAEIWIHGVQSAVTGTNVTTDYLDAPHPLVIGTSQSPPAGSYFNGYLQDLRITPGVARYTANFTPPAAALPTFQDLTCNASLLEPGGPLTCAPGAVSGSPVGVLLAEPMRRYDSEDGGRIHVAGQVTMGGAAVARKVRLHTLHNGRLIREAWSDPVTGTYRFDDLKDQPYYVWSEDYQRVYDPVSHLVPNLTG